MILINTGNGKGKTSSAIGTAIRNAGWGNKTAIVFFDKGGSYYGEQKTLDLINDKIQVYRFGKSRFNEKTQNFRFENNNEDIEEAKIAIKKIYELYEKKYSFIVADEIITSIQTNLIKEEEVLDLIKACPKNSHILLTGRGASKKIIEKADLVSEIKEVKHYFKSGIGTIKGIDY